MTTQQGFWLVLLIIVALYCAEVLAQDSAVEVFQELYFDDEYAGYEKDDRQDIATYLLYREIDQIHATIAANEVARREDDQELRSQLWKLALIVGGGGAVGGAGSAAVIKRRKK